MNILITGANGMLGRDLTARLAADHEVHPYPSSALDITDPVAVQREVLRTAPDLIINCAAYTDVDGCETERDKARQVNAEGPEHLAKAADGAGAALLHVSTDYVFDGTSRTPYGESDPTGPVTEYGRSKLAGEEAVRRHCPRHYIVRTAWLYGEHGNNFVATMLRLAQSNPSLTVVDDQVGNPTWTKDLADAIGRLIETSAWGTYHATNAGEVSWCGFAREIFRLRGIATQVTPVTTAEFPRPAPRPAYSALGRKGLAALGIRMRPWQEALAAFLRENP
ncbi:MAG: dTDP-4-dehydrorhamnose reductase [Leptospirillia bacterium]